MPVQTITNEFYTAAIDTDGAQLVSLIRNATGEEFIWQRDPKFWADSAPICFPVVGRLKGGSFSHEGKSYKIDKHGCVRGLPFFKSRHTKKAVALSVCANIQTKKSFPFSFKLTISFTLEDDGLSVQYFAENLGTNTMPMSLGFHPAFALDPSASLSDYEIHFSDIENQDLYGIKGEAFGLRKKGYLKDQSIIQLSDTIFDEDALVFKNIKSTCVSIIHREKDWRLDVETGGAPHLALWAKPRAPFICIEPWYICPDEKGTPEELSEKEDIQLLAPGDSFKAGYKILP